MHILFHCRRYECGGEGDPGDNGEAVDCHRQQGVQGILVREREREGEREGGKKEGREGRR